MLTKKRLQLRSIASLLVVMFMTGELRAAPVDALSVMPLTAQQSLLRDPSAFESPTEFALLDDLHPGSKNAFIIHIQDAHSNFSGQENLAKTIDALMQRYDIRLVLAEGGWGDCSLTPMKSLATTETWKKVARRFLMSGELQGEEYLNLTSDRPMKILGLEDPEQYETGLQAYQRLTEHREDVLRAVDRMGVAVDKLKARIYPAEILEYEKKAGQASSDARWEALRELSGRYSVGLKDFPAIEKLIALKEREANLHFEAANLEQAVLIEQIAQHGGQAELEKQVLEAHRAQGQKLAQFMLFKRTLELARDMGVDVDQFKNFLEYFDYLKSFSSLDLDAVLKESEQLERVLYDKGLTTEVARQLRGVDRTLSLWRVAHQIQMTSDQYASLMDLQPDFPMEALQAFMNRHLMEQGLYDDLIPVDATLDRARQALEDFYGSVSERDLTFIDHLDKVLQEEKQQVVILIAGGYHTPHLKELLRQKGYGYAVLTPVVTAETSQRKYEKLLLAKKNADPKTVRNVSGSGAAKDRSLSALDPDLKKLVKKDRMRVLAAAREASMNPDTSRLAKVASAVMDSGSQSKIGELFGTSGARVSSIRKTPRGAAYQLADLRELLRTGQTDIREAVRQMREVYDWPSSNWFNRYELEDVNNHTILALDPFTKKIVGYVVWRFNPLRGIITGKFLAVSPQRQYAGLGRELFWAAVADGRKRLKDEFGPKVWFHFYYPTKDASLKNFYEARAREAESIGGKTVFKEVRRGIIMRYFKEPFTEVIVSMPMEPTLRPAGARIVSGSRTAQTPQPQGMTAFDIENRRQQGLAYELVRQDKDAWVVYSDVMKLRLRNDFYGQKAADVFILDVVRIAQETAKEFGGHAFRLGPRSDEVAIALPSQSQVADIVDVLNARIREFYENELGFADLGPLSQQEQEDLSGQIGKGLRSLEQKEVLIDGKSVSHVFAFFEKGASKDLRTSLDEILVASGISLGTGSFITLKPPYLPAGAMRIRDKDKASTDPATAFHETLDEAQKYQGVAKDRGLFVGVEGQVTIRASREERPLFGEEVKTKISAGLEEVRKKLKGLSSQVGTLESEYAVFDQEGLLRILDDAIKDESGEPKLYLVRGPPENFYIISTDGKGGWRVTLAKQSVLVERTKADIRDPETGEMVSLLNAFNKLRFKSGRSGETKPIQIGRHEADGRPRFGFKQINDLFGPQNGNWMIKLDNLAVYKAFEESFKDHPKMTDEDLFQALSTARFEINQATIRAGFTVEWTGTTISSADFSEKEVPATVIVDNLQAMDHAEARMVTGRIQDLSDARDSAKSLQSDAAPGVYLKTYADNKVNWHTITTERGLSRAHRRERAGKELFKAHEKVEGPKTAGARLTPIEQVENTIIRDNKLDVESYTVLSNGKTYTVMVDAGSSMTGYLRVGRVIVVSNQLQVRPEFLKPNDAYVMVHLDESRDGFPYAASIEYFHFVVPILAAMQGLDLKGQVVEDLGSATGILALAALKLGAARVIAIDNAQGFAESVRTSFERNGYGSDAFVAVESDLKDWFAKTPEERDRITGTAGTVKLANLGAAYPNIRDALIDYVTADVLSPFSVLGGYVRGDFVVPLQRIKMAGREVVPTTFIEGGTPYTALQVVSGARIAEQAKPDLSAPSPGKLTEAATKLREELQKRIPELEKALVQAKRAVESADSRNSSSGNRYQDELDEAMARENQVVKELTEAKRQLSGLNLLPGARLPTERIVEASRVDLESQRQLARAMALAPTNFRASKSYQYLIGAAGYATVVPNSASGTVGILPGAATLDLSGLVNDMRRSDRVVGTDDIYVDELTRTTRTVARLAVQIIEGAGEAYGQDPVKFYVMMDPELAGERRDGMDEIFRRIQVFTKGSVTYEIVANYDDIQAPPGTKIVLMGPLTQAQLNAGSRLGAGVALFDEADFSSSLFNAGTFGVLVQRLKSRTDQLAQMWRNLRSNSMVELTPANFNRMKRVVEAKVESYKDLLFKVIPVAWKEALQSTWKALRSIGSSA